MNEVKNPYTPIPLYPRGSIRLWGDSGEYDMAIFLIGWLCVSLVNGIGGVGWCFFSFSR